MKISVKWLKDYVESELSANELADIFSNIGLACEGIEEVGDDFVLDLEVTSNRGDCLGHIGVARELAAVTGAELKMPEVKLKESERSAADFAEVEIAEPELCKRYTVRIISGIKVGPSPDWMRTRLEAVGLRSVNNVVDATNYAMLETGQPPHAFDYEKIAGGKIIVRKAVAGEQIVSIDGSKCELDPDMLIIADSEKPIAVAGVMGGLDSEVSDSTTTVLLEDAYFDPVSVRTTSRKLTLLSEACFRFERTVNLDAIDRASRRTAQLIVEVAGGNVAKGVVDVYPTKAEQKKVTLRLSRLNKLLGIEIAAERVVEILGRLSFEPKENGDSVDCVVPPWRSDVYREVDLIEEVARVYGYDKIPMEGEIKISVKPVDVRQQVCQQINRCLNSCGFYETNNITFVDSASAELFADNDVKGHLAVKDVSRKTVNLLRQTLIGSLLNVLKTNLNVKNTPCRVFEIADTFVPAQGGKEKLPVQETKLALVCDSDLRDLRGVVEGLIKSFNRTAQVVFRPAELVWSQAGAEILLNGKVVGKAGIVSEAVKDGFDLKDVVACAAELDFGAFWAMWGQVAKVQPIPKYPAIERDLSLIVDEQVAWSEIVEAVGKKAPQELEDVRFIGIYRGKSIEADKKSVTLSVRFRDEDGTLTHEKVDGFEAKIVKSLAKATGAEIRTV